MSERTISETKLKANAKWNKNNYESSNLAIPKVQKKFIELLQLN